MCISTLMNSDDLYNLPPGDKFCIESEEKTYVATKIEGFNSIAVVDVPELGEEGEGLEFFYEEITDDGTLAYNDKPFWGIIRLRRFK